MDPATVGGLAIGVTSLAFDVFDNSVKFFRFLSSMVDMPKDCEQYRLQLVIEYNRLLAWGKAVGLMDIYDEANVATSLGTNALELCGILSRIGWLLGEFQDINARWKNELNPHLQPEQLVSEPRKADLLDKISSLEIAYEKNKEARKHTRATNHIIRWMSKRIGDAKEIAVHPYRVRWVMVDKEAFNALLKDLHGLTERLHQLVGDHRQRRIDDITTRTYRELVSTHNSVNELKDMVSAVSALIRNSKYIDDGRLTSYPNNENDDIFRDLLRLKEINRTANDLLLKIDNSGDNDIEREIKDLISVDRYNGVTLSDYFTYAATDRTKEPRTLFRARGCLALDDIVVEAWIEWRYNDTSIAGSTNDKQSRLRVMTLAQMLHSTKPKNLYAPRCIGYVDDVTSHGRYGWIFAMPNGSQKETTLRSLHTILGQTQYKPTLVERVTLAWKLASSLQYLHTANWLHKGVHSGNILFAFNRDKYNAGRPILSGFDFSRPESNRTTNRSLEPMWDIYRWPSIQNEAPTRATSRKTYDIYSLGLVLLEIAHWEPLHKIVCLKRWPEQSSQDSRIRAWLLGEDYPPFKSNPLLELRDMVGDRYWRAVNRCIVAHGDKGLHIEQEEDQASRADVAIKLQEAFNELVVNELKGVSI